MKFREAVLVFILLLMFVKNSSAQNNFEPPLTVPSFRAVRTTNNITLDGKLSESDWGKAKEVTDFFEMEPRQGEKLRYETSVKVLFDETNLYFGIFCKDTLGRKGLRAQDFRRDFDYRENDVFFIQIDPQNLKRYCASFQTTPLGTQADLQVFDDTNRDIDWDALWRVRTHISDSGYYAEFAIPFKSLRYNKQSSDSISWGVTFARIARRDFELSAFPAIPQAYSPYRMSYAAEMKGLTVPVPSANIRFQPYLLYQNEKVTDNDGLTTRNSQWKTGGEIKWALNSHSVLDVTFNTDFAQVDVDLAVNNLTRFNVLFPEKRQFFLESSGVYAGANLDGIKPYFSRTIGLSNSQFNAVPVSIDAGLRFTNRSPEKTISGIYVHQRQNDLQAAANFGVFRYLKNYGTQNNVGVMLTHRLDESDLAKGFVKKENTTFTVDGFNRPNNSWTIQYLLSGSRDESNESLGFAASLRILRELPKWYYQWSSKFVDNKYVPGMGFVFANNTLHHNAKIWYIWRPKKWNFIRKNEPGLIASYYQNARDLSFQQGDLYIFPIYATLKDGSLFEYSILPNWQNINFDFNVLGIPIERGNYFFVRQKIIFNTDLSKKYSAEGSVEFGDYYNGNLQTTSIGIRVAPIPNIAFTAKYEYNNLRHIGTEFQNKTSALLTGGLRLALNANIQGSLLYQYNSFNGQGRWNIRGSWQFAPLSFLHIIFNESSFKDSLSQNQSLICKISYLQQF